MNVELKRVDIQLILVLMLIFPGLAYIYIYHRAYYINFDSIKLLVSAASINIPLVSLAWLVKIMDLLIRIFRMGRSINQTFQRILKLQNRTTPYKGRELASIKRELTAAKKSTDKTHGSLAELVNDIYKSSIKVDIPASIFISFLSSVLMQVLVHIFKISANWYLVISVLIVTEFALISNALVPNLRDYYLAEQTKAK